MCHPRWRLLQSEQPLGGSFAHRRFRAMLLTSPSRLAPASPHISARSPPRRKSQVSGVRSAQSSPRAPPSHGRGCPAAGAAPRRRPRRTSHIHGGRRPPHLPASRCARSGPPTQPTHARHPYLLSTRTSRSICGFAYFAHRRPTHPRRQDLEAHDSLRVGDLATLPPACRPGSTRPFSSARHPHAPRKPPALLAFPRSHALSDAPSLRRRSA